MSFLRGDLGALSLLLLLLSLLLLWVPLKTDMVLPDKLRCKGDKAAKSINAGSGFCLTACWRLEGDKVTGNKMLDPSELLEFSPSTTLMAFTSFD